MKYIMLEALWPIIQSFETSEARFDVFQTLQATMDSVWKDVHPIVLAILSDLERDSVASGKKCINLAHICCRLDD